MQRGFKRAWIMVVIFALMILKPNMNALAADAVVYCGSPSYNPVFGQEFKTAIYIRTSAGVGRHKVIVGYDPAVLDYIGGGSYCDEENGLVYLMDEVGNGEYKQKYMLVFNPIAPVDTSIYLAPQYIYSYSTPDVVFEDGTVMPGIPAEELSFPGDGIAPVVWQVPGESEKEEEKPEETPEQPVEEEQEESVEQEPEVTDQEETVEETVPEPAEEIAPIPEPEPVTVPELETVEWGENPADPDQQEEPWLYNHTELFTYLLIVLFLVLVVGFIRSRYELKMKKARKELCNEVFGGEFSEDGNWYEQEEEQEIEYTDSDEAAEPDIYAFPGEVIDENRECVISVQDVTMEFHLSTYNPSGLKDYLIQMVKRQISYRRLYALYHVSFDVFKGEVVGIIGTNGSGKSTLLKLISGALKPTSGSVAVDRKKVQLLTLGTGFDMELTARENVYLNGSIIGYSKAFLDEHYNEIVEFAELQDFMEEKVKNFSSGMVSRLGFAIATAGDAAEILILDEVLSVGDEFFRMKSLKRIEEMIHGGSTVLIVSHGMGTIIENCTKCVWIEKGELRMVGNPKEVCDAYKNMKENEGAVGA